MQTHKHVEHKRFPLSYRSTVLCYEKGQPKLAAAVLIRKKQLLQGLVKEVLGNISSSIVVKRQITIIAFTITLKEGEWIVTLSETGERPKIKSKKKHI